MDRRDRAGRGHGRLLVAAAAATDGDNDQELTGATRDRASRPPWPPPAAGPSGGDRGGRRRRRLRVEVRLDDGRQVEVNLDESFKVVNQEPDEDEPTEGADR